MANQTGSQHNKAKQNCKQTSVQITCAYKGMGVKLSAVLQALRQNKHTACFAKAPAQRWLVYQYSSVSAGKESKMAKVFQGVKGFIKRHKKLTVFLIIVLILVILIGWFVSSINSQLAQYVASQTPDVTVLSRTSVQNIVTASGTLESTDIRQVTTSQTADVTNIYVAEGDSVNAGDLLCQLDTTDIDKSIETARTNLSEAQAARSLSISQTQRKLDDATAYYNSEHTKYDDAVTAAKTTLDNIVATAQNTAEAQSQRTFYQEQYDAAYATWQQAVATYGTYSEEETSLYHSLFMPAETALNTAKSLYDAAYATFAAEIASAQAQYDTAIAQRDAGNRANWSSVEAYQDSLDSLRVSNTTTAYQTQLDTLLDQKDEMTITAPISGTVTRVNAEVGVSAAGLSATTASLSSALFVIQDTQSMQIITSVAEYDAIQVEAGMQVAITSDADTAGSWSGTVTSVSPVAIDTSGNFEVVVKVNSEAGTLTPGMSARMNIIVESIDNVYAVPFDAVVTNAEGQQVVYVYDAEAAAAAASASSGTAATAQTTREIVVTTGVESDYYIEIISTELADGMQILNDPLGVNTNASFDLISGVQVG